MVPPLFTLLAAMMAGHSLISCRAEFVACTNGRQLCDTAESLSIVNNNFFCCEPGFSIQWRRSNSSVNSECVCERFYQETPCIEDEYQCRGATSRTSDGVKVKCCLHGDRLNSVSNSMINGVMANYCKCIRYVTSDNPSGQTVRPPAPRQMTPMEEMQMLGALGLLPEELQAQMGPMSGQAQNNVDASLGRWASSFMEGLVQGLVKAVDQANQTRGTNTARRRVTAPQTLAASNIQRGIQQQYMANVPMQRMNGLTPYNTAQIHGLNGFPRNSPYTQSLNVKPLAQASPSNTNRVSERNPYSNVRPSNPIH
ncbi:uncharacterized protein LOC131944764 [Physella acuta]|uniref:uncharacterized protein LOC131944764 n=1 Tax=Physella acuta TaxID=109671 RepID=UPI0027DDED2E|nr:uncharacterized protein LOC131944764 [Physella acuta]